MNEVIFTSSSLDTAVSVHVWDAKTGTNLMTYSGGGAICKNALSLLGSDYVLGVEKNKPLIYVWPVNSQKIMHHPRLLCTGKITAMASSPDACYIAVAIDEKLQVYQVASGYLLGSGVRHYQNITVIRWSKEGSVLVTGGEDGIVCVWNLGSLFCKDVVNPEPLYAFSDHTLSVVDVFISGSVRPRLFTVSADKTCKAYDLTTGRHLLTVVFSHVLSSISVSPTEMEVFIGTNAGDIFSFSLQKPQRSSEYHIRTENDEDTNVYSGHQASVTCISNSLDGITFLSGSADGTVRIWHVMSKQCLRVMNVKGTVTNAFYTIAPKQMFEQNFRKSIVICPFQKTAAQEENQEFYLELLTNEDLTDFDRDYNRDNSYDYLVNRQQQDLENEVKRLAAINQKLYDVGIKKLLQKRSAKKEKIQKESESEDNSEYIDSKLIQKQPKLTKLNNRPRVDWKERNMQKRSNKRKNKRSIKSNK